MGMLDDAIREHLELKRRHGADPQEVARQEDEALGPIAGGDSHDDDDEFEPDVHEVHEDQLALVDDEPPAPYEPPDAPAEDDEPELPPVAEEPAEGPAFDLQQQTVEFSAEEREAAEESGEAQEPADELEETPEFLQETPEHDRLWFEQKPPRDFDF
jgi:hypothetical protein